MIGTNFSDYVLKRWRQAIRQLTFDKNYVTSIFDFEKKKKEDIIQGLFEVQFPVTNSEYYGDKRIKGKLQQQFYLLFTKKQLIMLKEKIDKVLKRPSIRKLR